MARKTQIVLPLAFPSKSSVGVGGLEPPTSASQTRRAGRLRYTPADKSIIRFMTKRQDTRRRLTHRVWPFLLMLVMMLSACNPAAQTEVTPNTRVTETEPATAPTSAPTLTLTPQPSETPPEPTPTPDCRQSGGNLTRAHFFSEQLDKELHFHIYLPPCYEAGSEFRFPVVYLLHGLTYTNDQWPRLGLVKTMNRLVAEGDVTPYIIVMPLEAIFEPPQTSRYGDAIITDLIPWMDAHYPTLPETTYRAIGGISRGAAWAVHLGFEHYELFASVGAHSLPLFDADGGRLNSWVTQLPAGELPLFFIDIGRSDQEWVTAKTFADLLDENNIPHEWYLFNGSHTESYWVSHLEDYLRWYGRDW